jgi:hypothetical protein
MDSVAWRISQIFSMKLKVGHEFEQRNFEAEFGQSKFFEPHHGRGKMM